jgi:hypothetical protein
MAIVLLKYQVNISELSFHHCRHHYHCHHYHHHLIIYDHINAGYLQLIHLQQTMFLGYIVLQVFCSFFLVSFLITFLSPDIALSIGRYDPFSLTWIIISGLLLATVLSLCNC